MKSYTLHDNKSKHEDDHSEDQDNNTIIDNEEEQVDDDDENYSSLCSKDGRSSSKAADKIDFCLLMLL